MNFIIFDLEWNNAYNYKLKRGMNEIIEIGAVKLDENLKVIDTFKQLIKPKLSKKLGSRFKNLYTLVANFKEFENTVYVDFISKYADAQKYCMHFIENADSSNQISLSNCAEIFEIDTDCINFHRALEDCMITAYCFEKVYDADILQNFIHTCDISFFERLIFKPFYIKEAQYSTFNLDETKIICPVCKGEIKPVKKYEFTNNTFRGAGICDKCGKKFWTYIRAKQTYDDIVVSTRAVQINKKRAKHLV